MVFPDGTSGKEFNCQCRRHGLILGSGRSPREGNGNPFLYFYLENSMGREAWQATVHGVSKELDKTEYMHTHTHISYI